MTRVVAALVVLALVVGGAVAAFQLLDDPGADDSLRPRDPASTGPAEPGSDRAPSRALREFYGQPMRWRACGDDDCARLRVPLDYHRPGGHTIELSVLRVPARREPIGALVVNPGGPGVAGTSYAAAGERAWREPLLDHYDIVGFDPRGTGHSAPVDCLSDAQLDGYLSRDPSPDSAEERRAFVGGLEEFGRGCVERSGALASHISTIESARDMDVLRSALGQARLDYFGASYGTELGATYAELFPERVGRFVLDGAVDVAAGARRLALGQARGFETALRAYVANCTESTDSCFLGDTVEGGLVRIQHLFDRIEDEPLVTSSNRLVDVGTAYTGLSLPLYERDLWVALSQALKAAMGGDGTVLAQLSDLYTDRGSDGYRTNLMEAFPAITCLDDPSAVPPSAVAALVPAFERASPTFGKVFAWGLVTCIGQQARSTEPPLTIDGQGAAPIVVIGTTRDPATPMVWAEHLAAQLDSSVLIRRDGDGHTGYNSGNTCVDSAVEDYLLRDTVPADGLSC